MTLIADNRTDQLNKSRRNLLVSTLSFLTTPAWAGGTLEVMHQGPESVGDKRDEYYWQLLDAALRRTTQRWGDYRVVAAPMMNGLRAIEQLEFNKLNVIARTTTQKLEDSLRPIRIPLDKGLLGYRVFLIRRDMQARLDGVRSLDDLRQFSIGQADFWADATILRNSGFKVVTGDRYEGLFPMLTAGRFDLFSRSVAEVTAELQVRQQQFPDLVIEKRLLLYYPMPRYFFVRRDAAGEQLAQRIEDGFNMMIKDGSFDSLFNARKASFEKVLNLKERRLFRIPNPLLPDQTPLNNAKLWYAPGK
jgi:hypothetical protein